MNECKIVEDLLPLYAEELVSSETREFVDTHCAGCEECERLMQRCMTSIPAPEENPKAYKKALRKNQFNWFCKSILVFGLVVAVLLFICVNLEQRILWKDGRSPVEQIVEAPIGLGKVTVVDWEGSGRRIGNSRNEGTLIWIEMMHVIQDEWGIGSTGSSGQMAKYWENVQVEWAPNGEEIFFKADLLDGGVGIFIHDYNFWMDDEGSHSVSELRPLGADKGYWDVLIDGCRNHTDFPVGWEKIEFDFYQWQDDSQTITFVYETDNGHRGLLDFHYPSETITDID